MTSKLADFIAISRETKRTTANIIQLIGKVGKYGHTEEDINSLQKVNKALKEIELILESAV